MFDRQLAELDAAKTAFFSNVSHELRKAFLNKTRLLLSGSIGTPLTLISGPLESCVEKVSEGPLKQHLKLALRNVHRLRRLVDSLMDFSKLAASKLEGKRIKSYSNDALKLIIGQFQPTQLGFFTA